MKKRTLCLMLAVLMTFSLLLIVPSEATAESAYSAKTATEGCVLSVSQAEAKPGETVTVELRVENNPGILGAILTVTWDDDLTLTKKPQNGEAFSALGLTSPKKLESPYNLVWYAQDLEPEDVKDGVIATLEFAVSSQAIAGERLRVSVSYTSGDVVDRNMQALSPAVENGFVSVTGETHTHTYNKTVVSGAYLAKAATCTEAASYYYSCECGEKGTATFHSGVPLDHNFVNGQCTQCHIAEAVPGSGCTIRASQHTAKPGDTVTVELRVEKNPGIQGAILTVTWDDDLTLTKKPQNGEAFSALGLTSPKKLESPYNLVWYAQDLEPEDVKNGVIAKLEFTVSEMASDGETLNVSVSYIPGDIVDREQKSVSCGVINGKITVSDPPVQARAVRTEQTVTIDIASKTELASVTVYLAEFSEQGKFLGTALRTLTLQAGGNSVSFDNPDSGTTLISFITGSGQMPLCAPASLDE